MPRRRHSIRIRQPQPKVASTSRSPTQAKTLPFEQRCCIAPVSGRWERAEGAPPCGEEAVWVDRNSFRGGRIGGTHGRARANVVSSWILTDSSVNQYAKKRRQAHGDSKMAFTRHAVPVRNNANDQEAPRLCTLVLQEASITPVSLKTQSSSSTELIQPTQSELQDLTNPDACLRCATASLIAQRSR